MRRQQAVRTAILILAMLAGQAVANAPQGLHAQRPFPSFANHRHAHHAYDDDKEGGKGLSYHHHHPFDPFNLRRHAHHPHDDGIANGKGLLGHSTGGLFGHRFLDPINHHRNARHDHDGEIGDGGGLHVHHAALQSSHHRRAHRAHEDGPGMPVAVRRLRRLARAFRHAVKGAREIRLAMKPNGDGNTTKAEHTTDLTIPYLEMMEKEPVKYKFEDFCCCYDVTFKGSKVLRCIMIEQRKAQKAKYLVNEKTKQKLVGDCPWVRPEPFRNQETHEIEETTADGKMKLFMKKVAPGSPESEPPMHPQSMSDANAIPLCKAFDMATKTMKEALDPTVLPRESIKGTKEKEGGGTEDTTIAPSEQDVPIRKLDSLADDMQDTVKKLRKPLKPHEIVFEDLQDLVEYMALVAENLEKKADELEKRLGDYKGKYEREVKEHEKDKQNLAEVNVDLQKEKGTNEELSGKLDEANVNIEELEKVKAAVDDALQKAIADGEECIKNDGPTVECPVKAEQDFVALIEPMDTDSKGHAEQATKPLRQKLAALKKLLEALTVAECDIGRYTHQIEFPGVPTAEQAKDKKKCGAPLSTDNKRTETIMGRVKAEQKVLEAALPEKRVSKTLEQKARLIVRTLKALGQMVVGTEDTITYLKEHEQGSEIKQNSLKNATDFKKCKTDLEEAWAHLEIATTAKIVEPYELEATSVLLSILEGASDSHWHKTKEEVELNKKVEEHRERKVKIRGDMKDTIEKTIEAKAEDKPVDKSVQENVGGEKKAEPTEEEKQLKEVQVKVKDLKMRERRLKSAEGDFGLLNPKPWWKKDGRTALNKAITHVEDQEATLENDAAKLQLEVDIEDPTKCPCGDLTATEEQSEKEKALSEGKNKAAESEVASGAEYNNDRYQEIFNVVKENEDNRDKKDTQILQRRARAKKFQEDHCDKDGNAIQAADADSDEKKKKAVESCCKTCAGDKKKKEEEKAKKIIKNAEQDEDRLQPIPVDKKVPPTAGQGGSGDKGRDLEDIERDEFAKLKTKFTKPGETTSDDPQYKTWKRAYDNLMEWRRSQPKPKK